MNTDIYAVTGMTCGHCVIAVTQELGALSGVTDVSIELRPGARSLVTVVSDGSLAVDDVRAAIDEAGYDLAASP